MGTEHHIPNLRDLATEDWRIQCSSDDAEAQIVQPDPDRRGRWVGPLATIPMGCTEMCDDGEGDYDVILLDNQDGRNLFAVAALPQFARLVCWAMDELEQLNGIHFDSTSESGRFHRELRNRCKWLEQLIQRARPNHDRYRIQLVPRADDV